MGSWKWPFRNSCGPWNGSAKRRELNKATTRFFSRAPPSRLVPPLVARSAGLRRQRQRECDRGSPPLPRAADWSARAAGCGCPSPPDPRPAGSPASISLRPRASAEDRPTPGLTASAPAPLPTLPHPSFCSRASLRLPGREHSGLL